MVYYNVSQLIQQLRYFMVYWVTTISWSWVTSTWLGPESAAKLVGSNTLMSGMEEYLRMHFKQSAAGSGFS